MVTETPAGLANITAQGCNACHGAVHDGWASSAHAQAGQNPVFQEALQRAGQSTACVQCHRPLTAQHPKLAAGYIEGDLSRPNLEANPAFDATLMAEGVGCAACHVRDGKVVSTRVITDAPHPSPIQCTRKQRDVQHLSRTRLPGCRSALLQHLRRVEGHTPCRRRDGVPRLPHAQGGGRIGGDALAGRADHRFTADLRRALTVLVDLKDDQVQRRDPAGRERRGSRIPVLPTTPTGSPYKTLAFTVELQTLDGQSLAASARGVEPTDQPRGAYNTLSDNRIPAGGSTPSAPPPGSIQGECRTCSAGCDREESQASLRSYRAFRWS